MSRPGHFGDCARNWNEVCRQLWQELGTRVPYEALEEIRRIRRKRSGKQGNSEGKLEAKILLAIKQGIDWHHAYGRSISYIIARRDGGKDELTNIQLTGPVPQIDYLKEDEQELDFEPPAEVPERQEEKMKIRAQEGSFVLPEEGEHKAELIEVEDLGMVDDYFNPGEKKHRMKLVYQLEGGSKQFQWLNVSLHPNSTFYQMATALLNAFPGEEIETEKLIGKRCWLILKHRKNEAGKMVADIKDARPLLEENGAPKFDGSKMKIPTTSVKISRPWPAARNTKAAAAVQESPSKESRIATDDDVPF
jgi:hypothetical protein